LLHIDAFFFQEILLMTELVTLEQQQQIVTVTLNRPEKRNAINWAVMEALAAAFAQIEQLPDVRVVIVRGAGKSFSAGLDFLGIPELVASFGEHYRENLFPLTEAFQDVLNRIENSTYPVIALLHGACIGLGTELALACDFRIAAEGTRMALPETRMGIIPDVGGTTRLLRLLGPARAKEYIMTGKDFDLQDAERWGLVNRVVAPDALDEAAHEFAAELIAAAPLAVSYAKKVIDGAADRQRSLTLEAWAQSVLMRSSDFERGMQAAMLKQSPEWEGR
jgi:enoyl-CoA hydratase/carnithine racemase